MRDAEPEALGLVDGLVQLSFAVQRTLEQVAAAEGLSSTQLRLLGILRDRTPTMRELAEHLGLDKSSVTGLIDRAERRGIVERMAAEHDGRSVRVGLTATGRSIGRRVARHVEQELATLTGGLTARERATLAGLASKIVASPPGPGTA